MKPMHSKKQPTGAMRSIFLTLAALLLCFCVKQTAYSQTGTITQSISKYDSLLLLAKQGLATMKDYDTLQTYHTKIWQEYQKTLDINEKWAYDDSIVRRQNLLLKDSLNGMQVRLITVGNMYTTERSKKQRAFGIGGGVGYDPFRKQPTLNVGVYWTPIRFSLRGAFLGGNSVQYGGGSGGGAGATGSFTDRLRGGN